MECATGNKKILQKCETRVKEGSMCFVGPPLMTLSSYW